MATSEAIPGTPGLQLDLQLKPYVKMFLIASPGQQLKKVSDDDAEFYR